MLIFNGVKTVAKAILQLAGKACKILFAMQSSGRFQVEVVRGKSSQHSEKKCFYNDSASIYFVFSVKHLH